MGRERGWGGCSRFKLAGAGRRWGAAGAMEITQDGEKGETGSRQEGAGHGVTGGRSEGGSENEAKYGVH